MNNITEAPFEWSTRLRVVLVETSLPRNIGSAARAMRTMGLTRLVLVRPSRFPDDEATALASGADDVLTTALVVDTLAEALSGCIAAFGASARRRDIEIPELDARTAGIRAIESLPQGEVALVFGSERVGLSNQQLAHCQYLVNVPTAADFSSLNVASAVQLLSYECRMAAMAQGWTGTQPRLNQLPPAGPREAPATVDQIEGFFGHLEQTLQRIGFFGDRSPVRLMQRLRRLYQRADLSEREVQILRGILAETLRSLGNKPS